MIRSNLTREALSASATKITPFFPAEILVHSSRRISKKIKLLKNIIVVSMNLIDWYLCTQLVSTLPCNIFKPKLVLLSIAICLPACLVQIVGGGGAREQPPY